MIALATLTVMRSLVYTNIYCPQCDRKISEVPGSVMPQVRRLAGTLGSGKGYVASCHRCHTLSEIIPV